MAAHGSAVTTLALLLAAVIAVMVTMAAATSTDDAAASASVASSASVPARNATGGSGTTAGSQPNVIYFLVDDVGWAGTSYNSNGRVKTPNLDALMSTGIKLTRNYVYFYCSPTRSSAMTGRLPMHVSEQNGNSCTKQGAVPHNMTTIASKLSAGGYHTAHTGKWHLGQIRNASIPINRGFDESFGYLGGAEDHYTNKNAECGKGCGPQYDLTRNGRPAHGEQDKGYTAYAWNDESVRVVKDHAARNAAAAARGEATQPLFLYHAAQCAHSPNEPDRFAEWPYNYTGNGYTQDYANYNGMNTAWDSELGNVTQALKDANMWDNTLLVFSSDNGGPATRFVSGSNANNYPLRGGKHTAFDGGFRVIGGVFGGLVPQAMRGQTLDGYVHIADWYTTVAKLAGVDPTDDAPGMPPVDGLDIWPYITGANDTSPRTEIPLSSVYADNESGPGGGGMAALIVGKYKLVRNGQLYCSWQGPVYPNASTDHSKDQNCPDVCPDTGCLFDIQADPGEHTDLAAQMPDVAAQLLKRAKELDATAIEALHPAGWRQKYNGQDYCDAAKACGGFWCPAIP